MHNKSFRIFLFVLGFFLCSGKAAFAQFNNTSGNNLNNNPFGNNPLDPNNPNAIDSTARDKNKKWENIPAKVYYTLLDSEIKQKVDTNIFLLHRKMSPEGWYHYLGNHGTAAMNMQFDAERKLGPQLGYQLFDAYRIDIQQLKYYNTTRPYSEFNYSLGSQQDQLVSILHSQNITRHWNATVFIRNNNSEGFFQNQATNYNSGFINTNYISNNSKFQMKAAVVYNNNRSDENGGIRSDSFLTSDNIINRQLIPTVITNSPSSIKRSLLVNSLRTIDVLVESKYNWGVADTLYNADSTAMTPRFTPKFGFKHQLHANFQKHGFVDKNPNYNRYQFIADSVPFIYNDTNRNAQILNTIENRFSLNGFIGKTGHQSMVEAGIANRLDIVKDALKENSYSSVWVNNYLFGKIQKEALDSFQWSYRADAAFYFAGSAIGDFRVAGFVSKNIRNIGGLELAFTQSLSDAPLAFKRFATNYYVIENELAKQSATKISGGLIFDKIGLKLYGSNVLAGNFIYYDESWKVQQYNSVFNVFQIQAQHDIKIGTYRAYSEALIQQATSNAPINIPFAMIRHISAYEDWIFDKKLFFNAGIELRYHTPFVTAGYTPYFNQFTFGTGNTISNVPEVQIFAAFRLKQIRLHASVDQVQQLVFRKNVIHFPNYPMQDFMFRFGFNWIMYN